MTSPTHIADVSPSTSWTTRNLGEAMPGVCTPLSWTFFQTTVEWGLRHGFRDLGALRTSELEPLGAKDSFIAPFFGRTAMNLSMMGEMGNRTPLSSATAVEAQLIGTIRDDAQDTPSRSRYPAIAARGPVLAATTARRCRNDRRQAESWYPEALNRLTRDPAAARDVLAESVAMIRPVLRTHIIVAMLANPIFDMVRALALRAGAAGLENELLSGLNTEEVGLGDDLWKLANHQLTESEFLARHGHHGPGGLHLSAPSWRENPVPLRSLASGYVGIPADRRPRAVLADRTHVRRVAEHRLLAELSCTHRPLARTALSCAGRLLPLRELGRSTWVRLLDGGRAASRVIADQLHSDGVLECPEDIAFCTLAELLDLRFDRPSAERASRPARGLAADTRQRIRSRRAEFTEYATVELPVHWAGVPTPLTTRSSSGPVELTGVPVGGGTIEGTARVVTEPGTDDFEPGEVLVCAGTDPAWVSLFLLASAVVIDSGGELSHGAIVAREIGVPAVTNTGDGSRRIRTGDRVRVDAVRGTVHVLTT